MKVDIERPNITDNVDILKQIRRYLTSLAEKLQWAYDTETVRNNENIEQLRDCADYVVENGIRDIWRYEKWKSGKIKLWAFDVKRDIYPEYSDGSIYRKADIRFLFPIDLGIKEIQYINSTASGDKALVWAGQNYVTSTDKGLCLSVDAIFATQATAKVQFYLEAIGKC